MSYLGASQCGTGIVGSQVGSQNWGLQQVQSLVGIALITLIEEGKSCPWWVKAFSDWDRGVYKGEGTKWQHAFIAR